MSQTVNLGHVVGPGVPNGGTAGQILKKNSATAFDTSWVDNTAEITKMGSSDNRTVAQAIGSVEASIAIVVNGDNAPQNLSVGQYIFLKNHSTLPSGGRHVTASISSGSAITSNNTAADSDGIANALNSKIENIGIYDSGSSSGISVANDTVTDLKTLSLPKGQYLITFKVDFATTSDVGDRAIARTFVDSTNNLQVAKGVSGIWITLSASEAVTVSNQTVTYVMKASQTSGSSINVGFAYSVIKLK